MCGDRERGSSDRPDMRTLLISALLACWVCSLCHSYGILTKNMIKTPDERHFEPVPLVIRDGLTSDRSLRKINDTVTDVPEEVSTIGEDDEDEVEEEEDDEEEEEEEDGDEETEDDAEVNDEGGTDEEQDKSDNSTAVTNTSIPGPTARTRLYQVDGLWEKTSPDIWAVLSAAVNCIWSGLGMECFTFRVVPMVKSMMGYHYPEFQPYFLAARNDETDVTEGRRRRRHHLLGLLKLMKGALAGAVGLKTLLLPVLLGLALVAGKSILISIMSVVLSAAAAWSGVRSAADRRVQATPHDPHSQYYMM